MSRPNVRESIRLTACQNITHHTKAVYIYGPPRHSKHPTAMKHLYHCIEMKHLVILLLFIISVAALLTYILYFLTQSPWACSFVLAGTTALFTLENVYLLNELKDREEEVETLRASSNSSVLQKMKELELRVAALMAEREEQRRVIHKLKSVHAMRKAGSF